MKVVLCALVLIAAVAASQAGFVHPYAYSTAWPAAAPYTTWAGAHYPYAYAAAPLAYTAPVPVVAEGSYVAANRGSVHVAPLPGHLNSASSINLAPAPGTL
ncbi:adult cuticle protein 1-like [Phlebotomus papatasi]|uniref:Uncharacterized protein n=1 Tax=Phlebotomus papatasi TaxID=29031 RepID=A0A1B0D8U8_PHLPP|nr:adult cuticle protein 1-like [Phlebotomus papatasi]